MSGCDTCFNSVLLQDYDVVIIALWVIVVGCIATVLRRSQRILIHLRKVVR
jgi:hypothetical protein